MSDDTNSEDEENENGLTMSRADIRIMRRILAHANVLPVIACADSLTDVKLAPIKKVVWCDLRAADLDFGMFGPIVADNAAKGPADKHANKNWNGHGHMNSTSHDSQHNADNAAQAHSDSSWPAGGTPKPSQENEKCQKEDTNGAHEQEQQQDDNNSEQPSQPVIRLRPMRLAQSPSRSRSHLEMSETTPTEGPHTLELITIRTVLRTDLSAQLPFALITPEHVHRHPALKGAVASLSEVGMNAHGHGHGVNQGHAHARRELMVPPSEDRHAQSVAQNTIMSLIGPSTTVLCSLVLRQW
ncbi:hypothetical protein BD311DRAFT_823091 [Dichomitus squalens]|uniref:Septin-type G domain-containing protein n=1 Tax=Dichomitus squalens TaxID=114155 RepID=A0A4Q9M6J8_9APHY|nr:hypothetical protein BD311DRAFT_823091 [Dichomitus squalens]